MDESTRAATDLALRRRMAELVQGYQVSAAIGAVARLGIADALADAPLTVQELASRVGADTLSLKRLLRALGDVGLFAPTTDDRVALAPLGQRLRTDAAGSARGAALAATEEWRWRAYGHVTHSIRTGEAGFRPAHGCGLWEYLDRHPAAAEWFNTVMSRVSAVHAAALVRCYDFAGIARLVDVGGGHGELLLAVLQANPDMDGVVFDLPSVIEGAGRRLATSTASQRCETVAGDFFRGVPAGGDAYVLSWILHDWDDASAVRILNNCRAVLPDDGRLLVIEMIVPDSDDTQTSSSADVTRLVREADLDMLVVAGGRERTLAEYDGLFAEADLRLSRVVALDSLPWTLMEVRPRVPVAGPA